MSTSDLLGPPPLLPGHARSEGPSLPDRGRWRTARLRRLASDPHPGVPAACSGDLDNHPELFCKTAEQIADERWSAFYSPVAFGGVNLGLLILVTAIAHAVGTATVAHHSSCGRAA